MHSPKRPVAPVLVCTSPLSPYLAQPPINGSKRFRTPVSLKKRLFFEHAMEYRAMGYSMSQLAEENPSLFVAHNHIIKAIWAWADKKARKRQVAVDRVQVASRPEPLIQPDLVPIEEEGLEDDEEDEDEIYQESFAIFSCGTYTCGRCRECHEDNRRLTEEIDTQFWDF